MKSETKSKSAWRQKKSSLKLSPSQPEKKKKKSSLRPSPSEPGGRNINSIFRSLFLKNQFEFPINSKDAWRYSYDECIKAEKITVGAWNTAYEALPGPHRAHFSQIIQSRWLKTRFS